MPANFLIVCGGAGRGILSQFDTLGFDGALQIDYTNKDIQGYEKPILPYNRLLLELPVPLHVEPTPSTYSSLLSYKARLEKQVQQYHSIQQHAGEFGICLGDRCVEFRKQITHVETAIHSGMVPVNIVDGMSQNPIVGRSYITRPAVSAQLTDRIIQLRNLIRDDQQMVNVWLVASTCGGTGNGIIHYVADVVRQVFSHYQLTVKFVRIGGLSYRSIVPLSEIATFWSVLTDYGYRKQFHESMLSIINAGGTHNTALDFYYIEIPDVYLDVQARVSLVRFAFVALSNPTMDMAFRARLSGNGVVMARVGEWGRDFNREAVYKLTLGQLKQKLDDLLQPRESAVLSKFTSFTVTDPIDLMQQENTQQYKSVAKSAAMKPVLTSLRKIKTELNVVNSLESLRVHPLWIMMQQVVAQIFDEQKQNTLRKQVQLSITVDHETEPLSIGGEANDADHYVGAAAHIKLIRMAQYAKAKAKHYLLGNQDHAGYVLTELREAWNTIVAGSNVPYVGGWFIGDEERQQAFIGGVTRFLQAYFRVSRCIEVSDEAESVIMRARTEFRNLTLVVERQIQSINVDMPAEYTNCADLDETFGGNTTWLKLLRRSLVGDLEQAAQLKEFRRTVEMGVIGLTEHGLKYKLQVPLETSLAQLVALINTRVGSSNSVWWQGTDVQVSTSYGWLDIRRFPRLPDQVFTALQKENDAWGLFTNQQTPFYVCSDSLAMGLDIYAVQGAISSINEEEQITQLIGHAYALSPNRAEYRQDVQAYVATQCARSIGLLIRVPKALMNVPHIQAIMTTMANYLVIDQS